MNESGENGVSPSDESRPNDGKLDFSSYSLQQLRELELIVDRVAQPLNHSNLMAEIARRTAPADAGPGIPGRFSRRNGWLGWLEAKRRRSPVFGEGRLELLDDQIVLHGWQRTWLGMKEPGITNLPLASVRNAVHDGDWVQFESKRRMLPARRIRFQTASAHEAESLAGRLPSAATAGFEKRWQEMRLFHERIAELGGNAWSVHALLILNLAFFLFTAFAQKKLFDFDATYLLSQGASFGPSVMEGEWWRLFSAQFLHGDLFHLLANMWVLFNAGRLARQLFGNAAFLFLYLASGVCGYVASIAWNPGAVAVGASGAIFGVFGALLAFMLRQRAQFPKVLLRAHWVSTLVFAAFNLASGFTQTNIDNAAHVGGLAAGLLLGSLLARPLTPEARTPWPLWRYSASITFVLALMAGAYFQVRGIGLQPDSIQKFMRDNPWYVNGERANLDKWQQLANMAGAGAISDAELSRQFRTAILPFWQEATQKLSDDPAIAGAEPGSFGAVLLEFAKLRNEWADAIADATGDRDMQRREDSMRLMADAQRLQARLDRLQFRAQMEYRPRALAHSLIANRIRGLFSEWSCVKSPNVTGRKLSPEDSPKDSPTLRYEIGCRAQQLFHERDYGALETLARNAAVKLDDLPDGSSSLDAIFNSLSTLMFEGGYDLEDLLGRTADWRRAVKDPLMAELVEVMIFREWAWTARGQDSADEVSGQAWFLFRHRSEMATAALDALRTRAQDMPVWHKLSIDVALDATDEKAGIQEIFDTGIARFPEYQPLYSSMLRVLMPRWIGSYEEVDELISRATSRGSDEDLQRYARLYWAYFLLEQDHCDIFVEAKASWTNMDLGFARLVARYPDSDYLLNAYAVMACVARDHDRYAELRPRVEKRLSASAWSTQYSLEQCDRDTLIRY